MAATASARVILGYYSDMTVITMYITHPHYGRPDVVLLHTQQQRQLGAWPAIRSAWRLWRFVRLVGLDTALHFLALQRDHRTDHKRYPAQVRIELPIRHDQFDRLQAAILLLNEPIFSSARPHKLPWSSRRIMGKARRHYGFNPRA